MRYKISVWHGEYRTLFYIVDLECDEIVETKHSRFEAETWIKENS